MVEKNRKQQETTDSCTELERVTKERKQGAIKFAGTSTNSEEVT